MTPPAIVIALWHGLLDGWSAARARWRADAARTWPLPGDCWHSWRLGYLRVVAMERRGEPGVLYMRDDQRALAWMPLADWQRTTRRMYLAERAGVSDGR